MAHPELVIASAEHLDRLADIPDGTPDITYAYYMDDIARQAEEGGGLCDRKLFELAFFAQSVKPAAYRPSVVPKQIKGSFDLSDRLNEAAGRALARQLDSTRAIVDPSSFGIVLGSEPELSPVQYEIEAIGGSDDVRGYRGSIYIEGLWTPEDASREISDEDIQTHTIFEIKRMCGNVGRAVLLACTNNESMGLFVGSDVIRDHIDITNYDYDDTIERLAVSTEELRQAAIKLELPIR